MSDFWYCSGDDIFCPGLINRDISSFVYEGDSCGWVKSSAITPPLWHPETPYLQMNAFFEDVLSPSQTELDIMLMVNPLFNLEKYKEAFKFHKEVYGEEK